MKSIYRKQHSVFIKIKHCGVKHHLASKKEIIKKGKTCPNIYSQPEEIATLLRNMIYTQRAEENVSGKTRQGRGGKSMISTCIT
jgi:hypothetical protein